MPSIILTDEQAAVVAGALQPVEVRDQRGNVLGFIPPTWTEADLAEAERVLASNEPGHSYEQVKEHLRRLERR